MQTQTNNQQTNPKTMKHKVLFNLKNVIQTKPKDDKELAIVVLNLKTPLEVTLSEFRDYVEQGFAFSPADFADNKKKNSNWLSQSIFALDFDSGITPKDVKNILIDEFGIYPNYMYASLSDSPEKRKFRVIFAVDEVVTCPETRKIIQEGLISLFKDSDGNILADKACKDASRYYLPGKQRIFFQDDRINKLSDVIALASTAIISKDGGQTRKIKKVSFEGKNTDEPLRDFDYQAAYEKVAIFRDFCDGKHLSYSVIFPLATNMVNIKGGAKFMEEKMYQMNSDGLTHYDNNDFNAITAARHYNYLPAQLANFSPYEDDWQYHNLLSIKEERGTITQIEDFNKITLNEAEMTFNTEFQKALAATHGVFLFRVPTGIGKTHALKSLKNVTIACATHKLKDELALEMETEFYDTIELPDFTKELKEQIEYFFEAGLHKRAIGLIAKIAKNRNSEFSYSDMVKAQCYTTNLQNATQSTKTVLTTHQKALFADFKHDTLIFDECPLKSLMTIKKITSNDVSKLSNEPILAPIYDFLNNMIAGTIVDVPVFPKIDYDFIGSFVVSNEIKSDFLSLLDCQGVYKESLEKNGETEVNYYFITKKELPNVKKMIILSATAPVFIYKQLFSDEMQVLDITDVQQTGEIEQDSTYSCSKSSLAQNSAKIAEKVGDLPVITFKITKNKFKNAVENMHFGNCAGYNTLSGKDIAVVGTYHLNNVAYFLIAKALGYKLKNSMTQTSYQTIEYNGYKFKFMTYDDDFLRNIQLSLIDSEQTQAIGRARTLRKKCTVKLFSNFPSRQTTSFVSPFQKIISK